MPKRLPLIPTLIVTFACAAMVGLGVWQLHRAVWKEGLLARYEAARGLPTIAYPAVPTNPEAVLFRRATGFCLAPTGHRAAAGQNAAGTPGWSHIVTCRTGGAEGPGMTVDIGWSDSFAPPPPWRGGEVEGVIAPDSKSLIRLVAIRAAPGLQPSRPPGIDSIPNNHRFYAAQWFFFAAVAALIYALALGRRWRDEPA